MKRFYDNGRECVRVGSKVSESLHEDGFESGLCDIMASV